MGAHLVKLLTFKWAKPGYRSQFTSERVNTFYRMARRRSTVPFEAICITDDSTGIESSIETYPLWDNPVPNYGGGNDPNCFPRLPLFGERLSRLFGPEWVWSDLDCFICGSIDHILTVKTDFKIWRPDGGRSKCNGSLVAHRAGTRTHIWEDFDAAKIGSVAEFRAKTAHLGSDQAWISTQLTEKDEFFEQKDGVYAFRSLRNPHREKHFGKLRRVKLRESLPPAVRVRDTARRARLSERIAARDNERIATALPANAAIVYFPGQWHPWDADVQKVYPWIEEHYK